MLVCNRNCSYHYLHVYAKKINQQSYWCCVWQLFHHLIKTNHSYLVFNQYLECILYSEMLPLTNIKQHKSSLQPQMTALSVKQRRENYNYSLGQRWSGNSRPDHWRHDVHAYSYVRGEGKIPENIVTSVITVWRVEYIVALLVDLTLCGIYYLFKCCLVSCISELMCLNSVIQNQLLMAELLFVPLSSVCFNAGSCWQDAGFLHHLQQRGDSVVVFSGSRCHTVVYRTCQCSDSFCDSTGETATTTY